MVNTRINFVVGLVILVAILILMFGVHFLKNTVPGEKKDHFYAVFEKVSTLQKGDPIKINGVKMGRVKNIELWKNKVRVRFDLKRSFKDHTGKEFDIKIPKNSKLTVQNIGLMGERQIEINLGDSKEYFKPGDILENGLFDAGIAEAMGTAGAVFEESKALILTIRATFDSTVGREEFSETFNGVLNDTKSLTEKLSRLVDYVDPKVKISVQNLEKASKELEDLMKTQAPAVERLVNNGVSISEKADALVGKMDGITDEVTGIVQKINSNEGTLGALISDTAFFNDLTSTLENADSLLSIIRKQGLDVNVDIF